MSYLSNQNQKENVTLEWAAMLIGVLVVILTTYLIFGADLNAYQVLNLVLGISFLVFLTYSFIQSRNLKTALNVNRRRSIELHEQLQSTMQELSNAELEIKEQRLEIEHLRSELSDFHSKTSSLEDELECLKSERNSPD